MGKMGYVKRSKAYDGAYKRLRGSPSGSQSGSAAPVLTQVPSTRSRGLLNCRK